MSTQHAAKERGPHSADEDVRRRLLAGVPVTERRLQLAGVSTALLEGGDGPPVVFLQGEFAAVWMRVIPDLVTTHRVIAPDLPGLGASKGPDGPLDADTYLKWLGRLIDETCARPSVLVGKGPAGALGLRFALDHRERLDRLVLVDSHGLAKFRPPLGMTLSFLGVFVRPTGRRIDRSFRRYCFVDADRVHADIGKRWELIQEYALDRFSTPSVRAATRRLMKVASPLGPDELGRVAIPTTLIWGRHDVGMPLEIAEAARTRYGWPLYVIEGARDDPAIEKPDAFLRALRAALGTLKQ
jgi:pimeloyl-ACP methyl ester carboxylesterase